MSQTSLEALDGGSKNKGSLQVAVSAFVRASSEDVNG
jgi:hypothetical protein